MEQPDLNAIFDMYAGVLSRWPTLDMMIIPSDHGPVALLGEGKGVLLDYEGNPVAKVTVKINPEWAKEQGLCPTCLKP